MTDTSLPVVELVVSTIATTVVKNEQRFCDLDSVAGDGDFGYSLARGFEKVLEEFDALDRTAIGPFLKKVGGIVISRCGGTSGPLWGTAFLRAGAVVGDRQNLEPQDAVAMLRAAFEGIQKRGDAALGDKTLLDALGPMTDRFESELAAGSGDVRVAFARAVESAESAAAATAGLAARRGRAAYTGERSRGSPDAGAAAIAIIAREVSAAFEPTGHKRGGHQ